MIPEHIPNTCGDCQAGIENKLTLQGLSCDDARVRPLISAGGQVNHSYVAEHRTIVGRPHRLGDAR